MNERHRIHLPGAGKTFGANDAMPRPQLPSRRGCGGRERGDMVCPSSEPVAQIGKQNKPGRVQVPLGHIPSG